MIGDQTYDMSWYIILQDQTSPSRRHIQDRSNPLEGLNTIECVQRFRLDHSGILDICRLIDEDIRRPTKRSNAVSTLLQVCAALRFFAQGAFYRVTGDTLDISTATMSRVVHRVARALTKNVRRYVLFPDSEREIASTKEDFYKLKRFPNVIGAIDGTHVEILAPPQNIEADYVNRKFRHTINVQAVANARLEFIDIVAKYPGRTHDAFIWQNSGLRRQLQQRPNIGWLLGDSGYPLEPQLMTPLSEPRTPAQIRYNTAHMSTRNVVERAFGVLKMRFRCLDQTAGKLIKKT
ncbi:putative nuclease HARBI1 [Oppia nitens]|uniref:putative nuclease HARBI1 n=1 Tax=Oppia nitens TaxID=1686743 RepID=UPI0023DABBD0|nr:putative nuclease HARBI1 [Oppia nitens]